MNVSGHRISTMEVESTLVIPEKIIFTPELLKRRSTEIIHQSDT
jgi:hypothetical protein